MFVKTKELETGRSFILYRRIYSSKSFDLAINCITDRFDRSYRTYGQIEKLFLKAGAASGNNYKEELKFVTEFYDNLHAANLELEIFCSEKAKDKPPSIRVIKSVHQSLTSAQRGMLDMVCYSFSNNNNYVIALLRDLSEE